jgi:hypothetical protein
MRTETVEYTGDGWAAKFTVSQATLLIGVARSRLRLLGERAIEPDEDRRVLRLYTYPDLSAGVTSALGVYAGPGPAPKLPWASWPPDFETFIGLPDGLVSRLEDAIYRLNPHWLPGGGAQTENPKAPAQDSTSGSPTG